MPPDYQTLPPRRVSAPRVIVLAVLLIGLAVLIWLVFFHHMPATNSPSTSKSPNTSQSQSSKSNSTHASGSAATTPPPSSSQHSSSTMSTTPPKSSSGTTTTPETAQSQPSTQPALTNTGPGNTIALFIGATVLGIGAGNVYLRRRLMRSTNK